MIFRIDIETHYEKRLQAESKSERLEMELNKMQDQFMMFSKILNDKQFDNEERLNMINNVHNNQQQTYGQHHRHQPSYDQDNNCSRRLSRAIEDTGSIISDYTEDDIDMPDGDDDHYQEHNQNIHLPVVPSTTSLPNTTQNQHRRSIGTKRNQRGQSASLTRNGEKKRTRTRSNDVSWIFMSYIRREVSYFLKLLLENLSPQRIFHKNAPILSIFIAIIQELILLPIIEPNVKF